MNQSSSTSRSVWTIVLIVVVIIVGVFLWQKNKASAPVTTTQPPTDTSVNQPPTDTNAPVAYACDSKKTISAMFDATAKTAAITLSDGRTMTLPQVVSADGAKYANATESIVFWTKGNNAFLTENSIQTYANCVINTTTSVGNGMTTFTDSGKTFSFNYPASVSISGGDGSYSPDWLTNNDDQTLGLVLVKATLPGSSQPKTNLGEVTFKVGTSSDPRAVSNCLIQNNEEKTKQPITEVKINGTTYTKFTASDAGAGNFYQTTSYRTVKNNQCYAVEYTIHSSNIGAYDPSQGISAFDQSKVDAVMTGMVNSFKFL